MSEYLYTAFSPLPTYPPPNRRPSNSSANSPPGETSNKLPTSTTKTTAFDREKPRSRRSLIRPASRKSSSYSSSGDDPPTGSTTPTPRNTYTTYTHQIEPDLDAISRSRANSSGGAGASSADGDSTSEPRASSSTASSGGSRLTAASSATGSTTKIYSPRVAAAKLPRFRAPPNLEALAIGDLRNVAMLPDSDAHKQSVAMSKQMNLPGTSIPRSESVSSASIATALSNRTVQSTDPSASGETAVSPSTKQPFVQRGGRTYINDAAPDAYPLPVDLAEHHRQALRTLLLIQVHGAPTACPYLISKPPKKVLEIGCGPGFWSQMCHRYFKSKGYSDIEFVGIDLVPLSPGSTSLPTDSIKPDNDMKWTFIQHDLRVMPWPFADGEFDYIFDKDMGLMAKISLQSAMGAETQRLLASGGVLEVWETEKTIRMLRPHVPSASVSGTQAEEQETASSLGAYIVNINTPLSAPLNPFLVEYNNWLNRALDSRGFMASPCTHVGASMLAEEGLSNLGSHRVAIPLSEVRWEREGVGGVVTKDGKSYVEMKGKGGEKLRGPHQKVEKKTLTVGQAALRRTALLTLVQEIEAFEPLVREASGKNQDEWDAWMGKMMADLMSESGTNWGECLESGAWWARKR